MTLGEKIKRSNYITVNDVPYDGHYFDGDNIVILYDDDGNDGRVIVTPEEQSIDLTGTHGVEIDGVVLEFFTLTPLVG